MGDIPEKDCTPMEEFKNEIDLQEDELPSAIQQKREIETIDNESTCSYAGKQSYYSILYNYEIINK